MACDTCVQLSTLVEELGLDNIRLKRTNKILRTVNTILRRQLQVDQTETDALFLEFCNIPIPADPTAD